MSGQEILVYIMWGLLGYGALRLLLDVIWLLQKIFGVNQSSNYYNNNSHNGLSKVVVTEDEIMKAYHKQMLDPLNPNGYLGRNKKG
jgi:hypothetical protein